MSRAGRVITLEQMFSALPEDVQRRVGDLVGVSEPRRDERVRGGGLLWRYVTRARLKRKMRVLKARIAIEYEKELALQIARTRRIEEAR